MGRAGVICPGTCGRDLSTVRETIQIYWGGPSFCFECSWCETCAEYFCPCKFVFVEPEQARAQAAQLELFGEVAA